MAPKLYKLDISPPARAAMMASELFNVPIAMVDVDLPGGAHLQPDFLKKNPLHTVPILEDGEFILHDSHAILMYFADVYGTNNDLYSKVAKQRALVNQKLLFDDGVLFPRLRDITYPAFIEGNSEVAQKSLDRIEEAYGFVEEFLTRTEYIAANHLTIADISVVATITSMIQIVPLNPEKYPKTQAWVEKMEKYDFYQKRNARGVAAFGAALRSIIKL